MINKAKMGFSLLANILANYLQMTFLLSILLYLKPGKHSLAPHTLVFQGEKSSTRAGTQVSAELTNKCKAGSFNSAAMGMFTR